mmetsp:Transcript_122764/g.274166  ORF Transcript_122764/g.274166 Transcript_122764/m.274166 type:complete len:322 (+) Transcript_122764:535-1500(+)
MIFPYCEKYSLTMSSVVVCASPPTKTLSQSGPPWAEGGIPPFMPMPPPMPQPMPPPMPPMSCCDKPIICCICCGSLIICCIIAAMGLAPGTPGRPAAGVAAAGPGVGVAGVAAGAPQGFGKAALLGRPSVCCAYAAALVPALSLPPAPPDMASNRGSAKSSCARTSALWPPGMASSWPMARSALRVISRMSEGLAIIRMDCCSTSGSSRSRAISGRRSMSSLSCGFIRIMALTVSGSLIICCTMGELMICCTISGFCIIWACAWLIIDCMGSPPAGTAGGAAPMPIICCKGSTAVSACPAAGGALRGGLLRQCTVAPAAGS